MSDLLTILQHADSAFPSGSFAFSNGIEGLAAMNAPLDGGDLRDVLMRPQWGAFGRAAPALSASFVHPLAIERGLKAELDYRRRSCPRAARAS